jgi:hypothetical protein
VCARFGEKPPRNPRGGRESERTRRTDAPSDAPRGVRPSDAPKSRGDR